MKTILIIALMLPVMGIQSQSIENFNGLNKYSSEVKQLIIPNFMFYSQGDYQGNLLVNYYSTDYGLVGYVYNLENKCIKMIIPTRSKRSFILEGFKTYEITNTNLTIVEYVNK